ASSSSRHGESCDRPSRRSRNVTGDHLAHPERTGDDSILDAGGLRVGHWTHRRAATGCTVVLAGREGATAACDIRGGAPGTRETDLLGPGRTIQSIHAVLLSGGSAFGLDAATGVMRYLEERRIGFATRTAIVPIVVGAVIYDLSTGRPDVRPDAEAGYRAAGAASSRRLLQGSVGAGTGATVAKLGRQGVSVKGGLGSASEAIAGGLIVGALAVVNAVGEIIDPDDGSILAGRQGAGGEIEHSLEFLRRRRTEDAEAGANTTLVVIATNAALSKDQAHRLATMAHAGLARTIRPSHTPMDGDAVFALSTGTVPVNGDLLAVGALGARAVERSVIRAVVRAS
ncbi:MAG TPA: P1 family peptidase, partial [Bryobacteraceae bacterium]|nr:P1 family peptidase [Bryobacteraceae bacterium]